MWVPSALRTPVRLTSGVRLMENNQLIEPADLWECDGSLRDVYIDKTDMRDWSALFEVARRNPYAYTFAGAPRELPSPQSIFDNRDGSHLLMVNIGNASINCHFFIPEEIELDIDPRQVTDPATHELILNFLAELSSRVGKELFITAENSPEAVYLRFSPAPASWTSYQPKYEQ
ncbi:MAG: hypothetical protein EOP06_13895 [Proteobacteria bacterium]|nr:MAG: hypothetical protein EOP06_13895 [Pseudomonadota bacterium]